MNYKKYSIVLIVILACIVMGVIDAIVQPGYFIKSSIKIGLFLVIPIIYGYYNKEFNLKRLFIPSKKGIKIGVLSGCGIYIIILGAYFIFKDIFDFSSVTSSLESGVGVTKSNFIWVATYIALVNSLLEEFFFRGFAFLSLKRVSSRRFAYLFSAIAFSLYHICMMIGWFGAEVIILSTIGLFIGGCIFNFFNEKSGNIYISWLIHMCANFAINTIGFILFGII